MGKAKCGKGTIYRKAYTRKDGTHVSASCIPDVGLPGKYEKEVKAYRAAIHKEEAKAAKLTHGPKRCPKGEIVRAPYMRKAYTMVTEDGRKVHVKKTAVAAACIKNRGEPGSKKKGAITILPTNKLSNFGYHNVQEMSEKDRRNALRHAAKKYGANYVIHALVGRANLLSRTVPKASKIMKDDQNWVTKMKKEYTHTI